MTTGEALVVLDARPVEGEGMASGDVVNTAARLQAAAPVDGILVDETTFRATDVTYRPAEPVAAKGKAEPVAVWLALGARASLGVDVAQAPAAPLVGREQGLEALAGALARVRAELAAAARHLSRCARRGRGGGWSSRELGGAGRGRIGADRLAAGPLPALWGGGGAVGAGGGGQGPGRHPLESDPADAAAAKLDRAVADLLGDEREAAWVQVHLRPLIGVRSRRRLAGTAAPRRSRPGGGSWRGWPSRARPCW